jgi:hypothetical protein
MQITILMYKSQLYQRYISPRHITLLPYKPQLHSHVSSLNLSISGLRIGRQKVGNKMNVVTAGCNLNIVTGIDNIKYNNQKYIN